MNNIFVHYTINSCEVIVHVLEKKSVWKRKRGFGNADPNPYLGLFGYNLFLPKLKTENIVSK